jgi:23S rRNA pseudouridine1911/1915/1917 synthase
MKSPASQIPEPESKILLLTVPPECAGLRVDKAVTTLAARQQPDLSRARVQALLAQGFVKLSGQTVTDASRKVKTNEAYTLLVPPPEKAEPEAQAMDLRIVYEDDDVIVLDKPAGLVVHPAPGNRDHTLVNALLAHCGSSLSGIGGVARPGIVHRLDKDTSGLIVVAKNDAAHHALSGQFADRSLSRTYRALVWGLPVPSAGSIDAPIGRSPKDRKKMAVTSKGRSALTHYKVIEEYGDVSLVECQLATGRTHQIRVHLAHIKHPVVGDPVYGKSRAKKGEESLQNFPRQALHAVALHFIHPRTHKLKKFTSKLPKDMQKLIKEIAR